MDEERNEGFTPGPWAVVKNVPASGRGYGVWTVYPPIEPGERIGGSVGEFYREADARLSAAAPDLLSALRSLLDWTDVGCDEPTCGKHRDLNAVVEASEAAISKATNHQPTESEGG